MKFTQNSQHNEIKQKYMNPWEIGDIYAYKFSSKYAKKYNIDGKYILFQKIDDTQWSDNYIFSRIHIYDKLYDCLPEEKDITDIRLLPIDNPLCYVENEPIWPLNINAVLTSINEKDYPKKNFTFISNSTIFPETPKYEKSFAEYPWKNLEKWLCQYYILWQDYNYNLKNNHVFLKDN